MSSTTRQVGGGWLERRGEGRLLPVRSVLRLQQMIGNRAVWQLLEPRPPEPAAPGPAAASRWRPAAWIAATWRRRGART